MLQVTGVHPGRDWPRNVRADIEVLSQHRAEDDPVMLMDGNAPGPVFSWFIWGDSAHLSNMLTSFGSAVAFGRSAEDLYLVKEDGHIVRATIRELSHAEPGVVEGCGYGLSPGASTTVPMSAPLFAWSWGVTLVGFSAEDANVIVDFGEQEVTVAMPGGLTSQSIQYIGPVTDTVTLRLDPNQAPVCISEVVIGAAEPTD